ncbi:hypothetical protein N2152v2_003627 [Parachlorella kessleri]
MGNFELVEGPVARGKDLWTFEGRLKWPVSFFPVRMTVIRSPEGALTLVSSFPPEPLILEELGKLGTVELVLAPNAMHCLWGAEMRDACPGSKLAGPPNALKRFPKVKWDAEIVEAGDLASLRGTTGRSGVGGGGGDLLAWATKDAGNPWMQEIVLLHAPSRTLIVTDLAFNFSRDTNAETPLPGGPLGAVFRNTYLPLAGGYRRCCPTKPFGLFCSDADAMCAVLDQIMEQDFDQVVMAHGSVVRPPGGKEAFKEGTVAFFRDVAERQRRRSEKSGPSTATLAALTVAAVAVAAGIWRLVQPTQ